MHDDGDLAYPLPAARATELFIILRRMVLLLWLVVPVAPVSVSKLEVLWGG